MYVRHLTVADFRSWPTRGRRVRARPVACWSGPNGQGKTNLVEALGYAGHAGQPPGRRPTRRWSAPAPSGRWCARRSSPTAASCASSSRSRPGRANRARLNGAPVPRPRDVLGALRAVLFAPEDLAIVRGDPSERRRFLDELLVARVAADGRGARRLRAGAQAARGAAEVRAARRAGRGRERRPAHPRRVGRASGRSTARQLLRGPAGRRARRCGRTRRRPTRRSRRPAPELTLRYAVRALAELAAPSRRPSRALPDEPRRSRRPCWPSWPGVRPGRAGARREPGRPAPRRPRPRHRRAAGARLRQPRRGLVGRAGAAAGQLRAAARRRLPRRGAGARPRRRLRRTRRRAAATSWPWWRPRPNRRSSPPRSTTTSRVSSPAPGTWCRTEWSPVPTHSDEPVPGTRARRSMRARTHHRPQPTVDNPRQLWITAQLCTVTSWRFPALTPESPPVRVVPTRCGGRWPTRARCDAAPRPAAGTWPAGEPGAAPTCAAGSPGYSGPAPDTIDPQRLGFGPRRATSRTADGNGRWPRPGSSPSGQVWSAARSRRTASRSASAAASCGSAPNRRRGLPSCGCCRRPCWPGWWPSSVRR